MKWWGRRKGASKAFTVIELLIVVVVIGVLATIVVVAYTNVQGGAHDASVQSDLKKLDDAFKLHALDYDGVFPDTAAEIESLDLKLNRDSYNTTNKANLYVCVNDSRTEYAVVAMSLSGRRFQATSESGIKEYTGGVTWNATTANYGSTCTSIEPTLSSPDNLAGYVDGEWADWTL